MTTVCETRSKPGGTRRVWVEGHWVEGYWKDGYWRELPGEGAANVQSQTQAFLNNVAQPRGDGSIKRMLGDNFLN